MEEVLPDYPDNHFDSCTTDGPYGIGFMGKEWDTFKSDYVAASIQQKLRKAPSERNDINPAWVSGRYDRKPEASLKFQQWFFERSLEIYRVLKPGGYFISFASPRLYHRMACAVEDAGFEIRDQIFWVFASGFPKSYNIMHDGVKLGSALKPAHEPILVARKPLLKNINTNFTTHGTGLMRIDECRVAGTPWKFGTQTDIKGGNYGTNRPSEGNIFNKNVTGGDKGRWPANLIHDGSEEVVAMFPDSLGQIAPAKNDGSDGTNNVYGKLNNVTTSPEPRGDSGSAARFFQACEYDGEDLEVDRMYYCAKTSRKDRNEGCESMPDQVGGMISNTSGQHITRRDEGYVRPIVKNNHPTVKPTELMRYLCRLFTPKGGLVLDPFCGSGSTGKAAMLEHLRFVGIDMDPHNIEISTHRCEFGLKNRDNQTKIFEP